MPAQKVHITKTPRPQSAIRSRRTQKRKNNLKNNLKKAQNSKKLANNLLTLVESKSKTRNLNDSVIKYVQKGFNTLIKASPNIDTRDIYTKMKNNLNKLSKSRPERKNKNKNKNNFYLVTKKNYTR